MNWQTGKRRFRKKIYLGVFSIITCLYNSGLSAAVQGKAGNISTGSINITLIIPPTLNTSIEFDNTSPEVLRMNKPTDFCVSGRGINQYSLSVVTQSGVDNEQFDYDLDLKNPQKVRIPVSQNVSDKIAVVKNCAEAMSQLILNGNEQVLPNSLLPAVTGLTIHAE